MSSTLPERFDSLIKQLEIAVAKYHKFPMMAIRLYNVTFQLQRWHDDLNFQGTSAEREMRELSGRDILTILERRHTSLADELRTTFDSMLEIIRSIQQHYQNSESSAPHDDVVAPLATNLEVLLEDLTTEKKVVQNAISLTTVSDRTDALHQDEAKTTTSSSLLCLDGGGVRSYSSILIVEALMDEVRTVIKEKMLSSDASQRKTYYDQDMTKDSPKQIEERNDVRVKDMFKYVVGSSSGGIIAIMLGRLHMFEDQCRQSYEAYANEILANPNWRYRLLGGLFGTKYNGKRLTRATRYLVGDFDPSPQDLKWRRGLFATTNGSCKTAVVAQGELGRPHTFRSYDVFSNIDPRVKTHTADTCQVWEVARATSAVPSLFAPFEIGGTRFIDGGFGTNNPTWEGFREATYAYGGLPPKLLVVSIGSGLNSPLSGYGSLKSRFSLLIETGKMIVTDTERDHDKMMLVSRDERISYFRFNVDDGLQEVSLDSWDTKGKKKNKINRTIEKIESATSLYLSRMDIKLKIRECAAHIVEGTNPQVPIKAPQSSDPFFEVPWKRKVIIGHDHTLRQIFRASEEGNAVALIGPRGIGKTHTAVEYCYQLKDRVPGTIVIWTDATTPASFAMSCSMVARRYHPRAHTTHPTDGFTTIRNWLAEEPLRKVLFVFDNLYDSEEYPGPNEQMYPWSYFSNTTNASLLITTRYRRKLGKSLATTHINIDVLSISQAKKLLLTSGSWARTMDNNDKHALEGILLGLEYLPLPLKLAAAYMRQNRKTTSEYLKILHRADSERRTFLDGFEAFPNVLNLTFVNLTPRAKEFLFILAILGRHAVPLDIMRLGARRVSDSGQTTRELEAYSLVSPNINNTTWRVHDLIREFVRRYMIDQGILEEWNEVALRILEGRFPAPSDDNIEIGYELYPHVLHVTSYSFDSSGCRRLAAKLLARLALFEAKEGLYESASLNLKRAASHWKDSIRDDPVKGASVGELLQSQANLGDKTVAYLLEYCFKTQEKSSKLKVTNAADSSVGLKDQRKTLEGPLQSMPNSRTAD